MKNLLEEYLMKNGYHKIGTNVPEFSLCFQGDLNLVEVIALVEDRQGLSLTSLMYQNIKDQAIQLFRDKGYENIHVMTLVFADDFNKIRELSKDDQFCWMIDREQRRIVAYENQVDDFYGLRGKLERFLDDLPEDISRVKTIPYQNNTRIKKYKLKEYISVTSFLVLINLLIYLLCTLWGDLLYNIGVLNLERLVDHGEYYRLITSVFLHADIDHIFGNMIILFLAGQFVEKILGHTRFLILYIFSGIGGSLVSLYFQYTAGDLYTSLGASGAVFGVLGALLVFVILRRPEVKEMTVPRVAFYLFYSIYLGFRSTNIDNYAHVGGLLVGAVLAFLLWTTVKNKKGNK
jgi:rhomboid protease GluP